MRVLSPAKINLHLRVGPVQTDGFHPLVSWMTTVGLFDTLDLTPDSTDNVVLECGDPSLPTDGLNLVVRAAEALQAATGVSQGVNIRLEKSIPAGGGLGGGSGNAATTLVALNGLWNLGLSIDRLSAIAATLGSDVPFFLQAPSALCSGRGEIVKSVDPPTGMWVVLILPAMAMPTPAVYRQLDAMRLAADTNALAHADWDGPIDIEHWRTLPAEALLKELKNDLEAPAFALRPDLNDLRQRIEQRIGRPVRMSGSGSTLFTLYDARDLAESMAEKVRHEFSVRAVNVPLAARV